VRLLAIRKEAWRSDSGAFRELGTRKQIVKLGGAASAFYHCNRRDGIINSVLDLRYVASNQPRSIQPPSSKHHLIVVVTDVDVPHVIGV
jgi:hypothetical protein